MIRSSQKRHGVTHLHRSPWDRMEDGKMIPNQRKTLNEIVINEIWKETASDPGWRGAQGGDSNKLREKVGIRDPIVWISACSGGCIKSEMRGQKYSDR
ncbi:hypothetical protein N7494_010358 [Penicillium frequentans]|uniref:Uncharacterized protein n=1 Tax=Penicillium frequentans TaxID=3151616 RepID=A0AAD6CHL0_9EURO|nr:hypothetical protein N7494_010358 [Penicillium glabrum]